MFEFRDDFVDRLAVGDDDDRVGRLTKGADFALRVALIPRRDLGADRLEVDLFAAREMLSDAAPRPLVDARRQIDLTPRVREDRRSLIATFRDDPARFAGGFYRPVRVGQNEPCV